MLKLIEQALSSQFNIKDDTSKQHKHDLVRPQNVLPVTYDKQQPEIAHHPSEHVVDHAGSDTESHIVRHYLNSNHVTLNIEHFKILNVGYNNNTYRRKISEALFVKQYHLPSICKTTLSRWSFSIDFN